MSRYSVFVPSFPQVVSVYTSPFVRVVLVCLPLSVFVSLFFFLFDACLIIFTGPILKCTLRNAEQQTHMFPHETSDWD